MTRSGTALADARVAYSVTDVAALLGVSTDKVYELVRGAEIPHKRLGRRIIIPRRLFDRWLDAPDEWASAMEGSLEGDRG